MTEKECYGHDTRVERRLQGEIWIIAYAVEVERMRVTNEVIVDTGRKFDGCVARQSEHAALRKEGLGGFVTIENLQKDRQFWRNEGGFVDREVGLK